MADKLKELEPDADRNSVTNKINSLRSSYRKEKKKINDSLKSSTGAEDIYKTTLWYYDQFKFLDDQEIPRQPMSNFDEFFSQDENGIESAINSPLEHRPTSPCSVSNSIPDRPPSELDMISPTPTSSNNSAPRKRPNNKRDREIDNVITSVGKRLIEGRADNRHEIFGRNVAEKLRNLPNDQRIYLEKIINDAIFEAELGNLSRNCYIHIPTPAVERSSNVPVYNNLVRVSAPPTPNSPAYSTSNVSLQVPFYKPAPSNITITSASQGNISDYLENYTPM